MTDAEAAALSQYATSQGITVDQAATRLAQQELQRRYRRPPVPGARVLPMRRR
ncbi:hypothetical protein GT347_20170 [Xylophilus rhododendri]|uniref:Uncharacterized protein n=1 Tax=Xylophilus rhododendri TaxID=2697032 RepID=A0A857JAC7_9BURK|nr:hypothetical protein [Xylophilus rhododendri]QHJ00092.1 hypothetical protein GT347_20170 [Xylophilus rhododendri]